MSENKRPNTAQPVPTEKYNVPGAFGNQDNKTADQPLVRDILYESNEKTASCRQGYVFIASITFNHILTTSFKHLYSCKLHI